MAASLVISVTLTTAHMPAQGGGATAAPQVPTAGAVNAIGLIPDWIQAAAAIITAAVSIILLRQLSLLKEQVRLAQEQLRSGVEWNKLNAAFMYYNSDLVLQREKDVAAALAKAGINFHVQRDPLSAEAVEAIYADVDVFGDVKNFLSLIEDYCTAVRIGAIDEDAAFAMNSALIMRWERVFSPFIDRRRLDVGDP